MVFHEAVVSAKNWEQSVQLQHLILQAAAPLLQGQVLPKMSGHNITATPVEVRARLLAEIDSKVAGGLSTASTAGERTPCPEPHCACISYTPLCKNSAAAEEQPTYIPHPFSGPIISEGKGILQQSDSKPALFTQSAYEHRFSGAPPERATH